MRFQNVISPRFVQVVSYSCSKRHHVSAGVIRSYVVRKKPKRIAKTISDTDLPNAVKGKKCLSDFRLRYMACTTKRTPRKNNRNFAILTNPINAPRPRRPLRPECATSDGVHYETRVICRVARFLSPVYYIVVEKSVFFFGERRREK